METSRQQNNATSQSDFEQIGTAANEVAASDDLIDEITWPAVAILVSGFFANFIVFGIGFSYGVFQEFYLSPKGPLYGQKQSQVAMIGTLATSLTYCGGIFQNFIRNHYSTRLSMSCGTLMLALGMILAGSCTQVWQFSLTQGVMFGIGSSTCYLPPVIYGPQYFKRWRGTANGIIFSGTGFGALSFAFLTRYLLTAIGWRWTLRTLGLISLIVVGTCSQFVTPHPDYVAHSDSLVLNMSVIRSRKFLLQILAAGFQSLAYLIPLTYMSSYGITLGFTENQGATFIGINNAINAVAKIAVGRAADHVGRVNMLAICCLSSTVVVFALWLVPQRETFTTFVVLYGVTSGPIISLLPATLVETFGISLYHSVSGLLYFSRGVGNALGSPIAGLLVGTSAERPSNYRSVIIYTGTALAMASLLVVSFRLSVNKRH
ncbi:hypothetical protein OGAPHI_000885 [Ogataea philodendri]|uniref:Major facilitator superfamily (MFS) profile domain-containing protein n=1 Tax=Ogataea philodendri TaxID=1378263 RepID=A0A9P8T9K3_9ASCO|nr:uncharacterized protein OGAPHI_000885 [Ogataea philodendri]KAH3670370.1 hypothetical protein OGAPHI_000885 [Ogataea philodendri]